MKSNSEGKKLPQYLAAISVCVGSAAAGAVLGWTANIAEEIKKEGYNDISINDDELGWIGSFMTLGAMLMCFPIGLICDWLGRKLTMLMLVVPFTVGWLLIIFANSLAMLYIGRFITGMAGGAFCVSAPLYTSEIAQTEIRGALGSYFQLLLTVGILFSYVVGKIASVKVYTIICAILPLVFGLVFALQPETPVYQLMKGNDSEAKKALIRLRGKDYNADAELNEIKKTLEENEKTKVPFFESFKKRATKKAAIISFSLMFFQQAGGINAVVFYTSTIFESSGSDLDPQIATIIVGVVQVVSTFISSLVVDRLGRRILLLVSDIFMAISGVLLGIFFTLKEREAADQDTIDALGFLPIVSLCIFMIAFSLGFGPIPWLISSELFPPEVKSIASSAAGTFNWFMAFLITKFYLDLKNGIGGDTTFYIFAGISVLGTLFILVFVPETKGKSLDEIQVLLGGEKKYNGSGIDNPAFSK